MAYPGMPRRPKRAVLTVIALFAGVGVLAAVVFAFAWQPGRSQRETLARQRPQAVPSLAEQPFVSPSAIPPAPELKQLPPVSIVGPTWAAGETNQLVHPRTLPFAFRAPSNWSCARGSPVVVGISYVCDSTVKTDADVARVSMVLRRCAAAPCTAAEIDRFGQDWLMAPVTYQQRDATTWYADTSAAGFHRLTVSHVFRDVAGGPGWHVGLHARSAPGHTAAVQKVVNDVRTQTP